MCTLGQKRLNKDLPQASCWDDDSDTDDFPMTLIITLTILLYPFYLASTLHTWCKRTWERIFH